jgi:hypothetical protein
MLLKSSCLLSPLYVIAIRVRGMPGGTDLRADYWLPNGDTDVNFETTIYVSVVNELRDIERFRSSLSFIFRAVYPVFAAALCTVQCIKRSAFKLCKPTCFMPTNCIDVLYYGHGIKKEKVGYHTLAF